jgi:hypothetical protein
MIFFVWQIGSPGISYLDKMIGEVGKKKLQQESPGQMLQPFMWMGYIPVLRYISFEEVFRFFNLPNSKPGGFIDSMLKKNRHGSGFPLYFAARNFIHNRR